MFRVRSSENAAKIGAVTDARGERERVRVTAIDLLDSLDLVASLSLKCAENFSVGDDDNSHEREFGPEFMARLKANMQTDKRKCRDPN